jgi:phospho-N-acetylmuramoyl-pentapeptide-transferase
MGDTGSLAIGGSLGFIVLASGAEMLLPLIGFIFLIEFFSSVLQVIYFRTTGRRLLPIAPVHHICELHRWSENQIVTRMTAIAIVPTMIALVLII